MRLRRLVWLGAAVVVAAVLIVGLRQRPRPHEAAPLTLAEQVARVRGGPPALERLHAQAGRLVPGGRPRLTRELRRLRGHPVVVNVWASWCPPCRAEAPLFQDVSSRFGRQVAFLGVDSGDQVPAAQRALRTSPVTYPSVLDPKEREADRLGLAGLPATVFYDRSGHQVTVHQGQYLTTADLSRAVARLVAGP